MNELTQIRIRDNMAGGVYRLIGFSVSGDDRSGFPVNKLVLYDDANRIRITVTDPKEMKRLSIVKE